MSRYAKNKSPYTHDQIGGAERSGGVVKDRIGANLLGQRSRELQRTFETVRQKYTYNWRSLYGRFHTHIAHRDGVVVEDRKPQQAYLNVYGCKAFAMAYV